MNWCDVRFWFCIELVFYVVIKCMINYFCWILMRWYSFTNMFFMKCFNINNNTWLCISLCLKINDCIECFSCLNVDTREVWISYNITTVWCIQNIWFANVDVWVNSNKSPLIVPVKNVSHLFLSWKFKNMIIYFVVVK